MIAAFTIGLAVLLVITSLLLVVLMAGFAGLADHHDRMAVEARSDAGSGLAALLVALFDIGTITLEALAVGLVEQFTHRGVDFHDFAQPAFLDGADE